MYELSVAQELYTVARARADEMEVRELESVRVAVGELAGVTPDLLRSAWRFVTAESADENSRLDIDLRSGRQICPQCGALPGPDVIAYPAHCERCKCHMRVESGDRVELLEIRFQQELALA
ncbi:hydrogenase expression/formation protein HypA [Candidatus Koribacter versatilis Ellin345]|uniref:Hydrogenase expression/formation protein HypA n=1 Tax=Koribacter versatilis (strain Ellin345) TaxID=204669 RepID=Q1IRE2_KORVE|nr:hydrogenase maturation nickel metallochaperone HypA [Candidatus Koribacter versatilis]ABF40558.1 hydrogenase expression/formation protein HypA [Candidatus Koribacter versatilis Ellin345]